jgi:hypothetical protein
LSAIYRDQIELQADKTLAGKFLKKIRGIAGNAYLI